VRATKVNITKIISDRLKYFKVFNSINKYYLSLNSQIKITLKLLTFKTIKRISSIYLFFVEI
jgi:hypothetical protein